jgi:lipoate-protein ligase A
MPSNHSIWFLLNSGPCPPAFNMALDEALLESVSRRGKPVLRFYGWTEPAATFGYFQKYADVERATPLRPLIRRPTGGGIVPHDADWTYSLAFPPGHEWHSLKAEESYRRVHAWIQGAFAKLKIATEVAPGRRCSTLDTRHSSLPAACFIGHEKSDLLWKGGKIAGAAQRRNKSGLLIQGSVQPSPFQKSEVRSQKSERAAWQDAMCAIGSVGFGVEWLDFEPDDPLRQCADELVRTRFSLATYNRKR